MTLSYCQDRSKKFCRFWVCCTLLSVSALLSFAAAKYPISKFISSRNKTIYKTKEILSLFSRTGYKAKNNASDIVYIMSWSYYKISFYFTIGRNGLLLVSVARAFLSSHKAFAEQNLLPSVVQAGFQELILESEERELISIHCNSRVPAEDLITDSHTILALVILIYTYKKVFLPIKEIRLREWRCKHSERAGDTMVPSYVIFSLSVLGISTVIGFFTNSFIIVAHGMDRARGRNINPRELILSTLGLFNIVYQLSMAANDFVLYLWSDVYFSDTVYTIFSIVLLFTIFSSFWFTFCLCGFFYVMLVTFQQTFIMRLKQNIADVVPWMLFSSVLLSLIISVPVVWNIQKDEYLVSLDGNFSYNSTVLYEPPHISLQYLLVTSIIGCLIPLIMVAVANILIIKSLCLHAKHLGKNSGGMNVQSVEASVSAAQTVSSLLILYLSFYISQILLIMAIFDFNSIGFCLCLVIVYAYSPLQSIVLILGSPKLKSALVKMLDSLALRRKILQNGDIQIIG